MEGTDRRISLRPSCSLPLAISGNLLYRNIVQIIWSEMTKENIHWLLSHPQAWEKIMEQTNLTREEVNTLCSILLMELVERETESMPESNLSEEEELFLFLFPCEKSKLENNIKELNALADQVDASHKRFTKVSLLASSSGAVSGAISILGMALAPLTAGGSLMLSAAGASLGAAAAITGVVTNVLEKRSNSAARDKANSLLSATESQDKAAGGIELPDVEDAGLCINRCTRVIQRISDLRAYQLAQANSGFIATVKNFVATKFAPILNVGGMESAFQGTAQGVASGSRLLGVTGAGFFMIYDMNNFWQKWRHLQEGAQAEMAEELKALARMQEQKLSELTQHYQSLQQKRRPRPRFSGRARKGADHTELKG
ncbi:apolipoprotein L5 isoform X2 [Tupaia chinensis]|uniref:apolipoprotein L5 isoform X2 n=1 Tax=Tupaia chinensis TaxID=246437 RepID=UPI000FFB0988|nr:apolipoprotein L5 isoform X2 [Tupaia chinensis]